MARSSSFNKSRTGTPSKLGGSKAKSTLNPWGKNTAQGTTRKAAPSGTARKRGTPAADLFKMNYPANDPAQWPIEGDKRLSPTAPTQAKADFHNAAVNHAYLRTTGLS